MKLKLIICIILTPFLINSYGVVSIQNSFISDGNESIDTLPSVLPENRSDLIESTLRNEAYLRFASHKLPDNIKDWEVYATDLRNEVINKAGIIVNHSLPLNINRTGSKKMRGYTVENITFQTRPGVYATANLFIPDGVGPFPGVINMLGHWVKGKIDTTGPQAVGHSLAANGYVCLSIDPWGAGERSTVHGEFEYHGANLGASLMNIGESLVGVQISDNIRGVDLLCSLPYVDPSKIGATGASGGGNQTMWLSAMDERIKAAVPVVSVGTFESYIMRSNCICETLIDGLTFTEEAGVLALSNAIMPINRYKDNPAFLSTEMLRSYDNAKKVFDMKEEADHISYNVFDLPHGYAAEDRQAMLGWFNYHLKGIGNGDPISEKPFEQLPEDELMVFATGKRDANVVTTEEYCFQVGSELRADYMNIKSFNTNSKKSQLNEILRIKEKSELKKVYEFGSSDGWERIALETTDNKIIPLLLFKPGAESSEFVIITNPFGKKEIPYSLIKGLISDGKGVVVVDLTGCGEASSETASNYDRQWPMHTIARAEIWLGKTTLGEWVKELKLVTEFIKSHQGASKVAVDGTKETGLAGLFLSALEGNIEEVVLREAPVSYLFDNRKSIDFFNMAIHLPGFLKWGDISLVAAMSGKNVTFINPLTMSGEKISETKLKEFEAEFEQVRKICRQPEKTFFKR